MRADLHLHTDCGHGDLPENIAAGIVNSQLDAFAITEHNRVSEMFFLVQDMVNHLANETGKQIAGILGSELTINFEGSTYHVGYLFSDDYNSANKPNDYPPYEDFRVFQQYMKAYPGVAILNHPTVSSNGDSVSFYKTLDLLRTRAIRGVEILNSRVIDRDLPKLKLTMEAIYLLNLAKSEGIPLSPIGASDAHVGANHRFKRNLVGSAFTEFPDESNIIDGIREGRTKAICSSPENAQKAVRDLLLKMQKRGADVLK